MTFFGRGFELAVTFTHARVRVQKYRQFRLTSNDAGRRRVRVPYTAYTKYVVGCILDPIDILDRYMYTVGFWRL